MTTTVAATAETTEGVRAALAAYAHAVDDDRPADVAALFTEDGECLLPGTDVIRGRVALAAWFASVPAAGRHLVLNTLVSGTDEEAEARSDLVFVKPGEAGWGVALVGRYADRLRRVDGRWLFTRRELTFQR
jgi:hypothetical protein